MTENNEELNISYASPEQAEELWKIYRPYVEQTAVTFEYQVPALEEFRERISNTLKKYPYLVAKQQGKITGYAYAGAFKNRAAYDWSVETSIYVDQNMKRQGIGKRLYERLEQELASQGILNVNACIAAPAAHSTHLTADSIIFHKKMGYKMAGRFHQCGYKFNQWYDMVWMEKMLGEHLENQPQVQWPVS